MNTKYKSSEAKTKGECQMYRVISKNRATGETEIVASDRRGEPLTKEQAEKFAERCILAETNPDITYEVEQF